ncbi:hypothetical protein CL656_00600 [bacterium]|nr:hypothetical protein [bacterium]|tara:strand:- start:4 stop:1185 length:1182 start_codon:yes stop_codon:yes gene_type:complete
MKKFTLGLILTFAFLSVALANFTDVSEHIFKDEIQKAFDSKLINGYKDGSFRPDQPISRAEALKILLSSKIPENYTTNAIYFNDYNQSDWFYKFVNFAKENSIVNGYNDGSFKPGNNITISESLKILFETRDIEVTYLANQNWYESLNNKAMELNLYEKSPNNFLNVNDYITRSELVYLIDKLEIENQTNNLNFNWNYQNDNLSIKTLKSNKYFKLENSGILVMFEDGYLSFEIINNTYDRLEDSLVSFQPLEKNQIVNSIFFDKQSVAYGSKGKYFEQSLDNDKNLIYRISIEKDSNIQGVLNNFSFDTEKLNRFEKFDNLKQSIIDAVLSEGSSSGILEKIQNKKVLYTDVIGIGLGPIDYIYLIDLNLTVKNERNSATILQIKDGENSDF